MRISVVIPAWNEADSIGACLASVNEASTSVAEPVESLVAPGASTDATAEIAAAAGARVVPSAAGRGVQLAAAAAVAEGEVLLFLHADNRLGPDCLRQLVAATSAGHATHGAFRQRIEAPGWRYRALESGNALRARWLGLPYGDQTLFVTRAALRTVGGMPALPLMEDVALARRLSRRFGRPRLLPGPVHVSARRWQQRGVVRQTLRNWSLVTRFLAGVPAERLVAEYRPHRASPAADDARPD